jgi:hypothetical protein
MMRMADQIAVGQAMDAALSKDMGFRLMDACWATCYDAALKREDLIKGPIPDEALRPMQKCETKCVARYYEVLGFMQDAREKREREAALGLAPGSLSNE